MLYRSITTACLLVYSITLLSMSRLPNYPCRKHTHFRHNNQSYYAQSDYYSDRPVDAGHRQRVLVAARGRKTLFGYALSAQDCIFRENYYDNFNRYEVVPGTARVEPGLPYITAFGWCVTSAMITTCASLIILMINTLTQPERNEFNFEVSSSQKNNHNSLNE